MKRADLVKNIRQKRSYLVVGLDSDIEKIPAFLRQYDNPLLEFNKRIIDATKDYCVGYKINTAFYESAGLKGWEALELTARYIPENFFTIADAKRGDIGNTSAHYARAFFDGMGFDALTVNPYMGADSVQPFLEYTDKWTIVLGLTSNSGSADFQQQKIGEEYLYEAVIRKVAGWGNPGNLMFVAGATKDTELSALRKIIPEHFLLVPGVGAQGGSLQNVTKAARNEDCGLLVNSSRSIIYASGGEDFAEAAAKAAANYHNEMKAYL